MLERAGADGRALEHQRHLFARPRRLARRGALTATRSAIREEPMKQYVLDEPMAAAPPPVGPQTLSLLQPGWWRWLVLAILLEAVALAVLYVALNGVPGASRAEPSPGIAYVASFSFPREAEAAPALAQPAEARVSRIRQEHGRYLVDLHDEAPAAALAMLARGDEGARCRQRHLHRQRAPPDAIGRRHVAARSLASRVRRRRELRHRLRRQRLRRAVRVARQAGRAQRHGPRRCRRYLDTDPRPELRRPPVGPRRCRWGSCGSLRRRRRRRATSAVAERVRRRVDLRTCCRFGASGASDRPSKEVTRS